MSNNQNFPITTAIIIGILFGAAIFGLWWFKIEPVYALLNPQYTYLTGIGADLSQQLNLTGIIGTIGDSIAANPAGAAVTALSGVAAVMAIVSKIRADHLKNQAQEKAANREIEIDNYYKKQLSNAEQRLDGVVALETKITDLESQITDSTKFETQITDLENKLSGKEESITTLMKQIEAFKLKTYERVVVK